MTESDAGAPTGKAHAKIDAAPAATDHAHGRLASTAPGRVRVRLHRPHRDEHLLRRVHDHLSEQPGVTRVETKPSTGSVVVHYDAHRHSHDEILAMFRDVGVVVRGVMAGTGAAVPEVSGPAPGPGSSQTALTVVGAVTDLDRRISALTGRKVDLKLLFPLTLGVLGLRQVMFEGLGLAQIPGYVLLWYAFDAFFKLHATPTVGAGGNGAAEPSAPAEVAGGP